MNLKHAFHAVSRNAREHQNCEIDKRQKLKYMYNEHMHAVMRKISANHKGTLFTTHLNVSEIPGKVAAVPIRRKRNEQRSPDSDCSTRGIPISLRLNCSPCQLKVIYCCFAEHFETIVITWLLLHANLPAKWNGIM